MKVKRIAENNYGYIKGLAYDLREDDEYHYEVKLYNGGGHVYLKKHLHRYFEIIQEKSEDEKFRNALINIHQ